MTSPLLIAVRTVREKGPLQLTETVAPGEFQECLGDRADLVGPLKVELDVRMRAGQVAFAGQVAGRWELECCRCLAHNDFDYAAPVEGACPGTLETLDAVEEVRQALVLALPMRIFCRPDCRGLCPQCGANRNLKECGCAPPAWPTGMRKA